MNVTWVTIIAAVPADRVDDAVDFWAAFTGWERRTGAMAEFDYLVRPPHIPIRLLLQRLGEDDVRGARAHLDLSSDDVESEVRRHEGHGAVAIGKATHWTILRDPVGLVYCVTDRLPGR